MFVQVVDVMLYVDRDACEQRIVKFVATKADLLFCKPDTLFKSESEESNKRASTHAALKYIGAINNSSWLINWLM